MSCISPESFKKNGIIITVPCGKCLECINTRRKMWAFRLEQELKFCRDAYFITITYNNENLKANNYGEVITDKKDIQDWLKKLRHALNKPKEYILRKDKKLKGIMQPLIIKVARNVPQVAKFKYFLTAEIGSNTLRPHYHGIFFNVHADKDVAEYLLNETWGKGLIYMGQVSPASINYTTKYTMKSLLSGYGKEKYFKLCSKGLGIDYIEMYGDYHRNNSVYHGVKMFGEKVALPRYYKEKIFNPFEIRYINNKIKKERDVKENEIQKEYESRNDNYHTKILEGYESKKRSIINKFNQEKI